jgi:hypothetical protein
MSHFGTTEWYAEVAQGKIPGSSLVHKFGAGELTTTIGPISHAMTYQTPTTATALEFVSGDANDTSAGSGAREITVIGLDSSWNEVSQTVITNGTTAVALTTDLTRLYRWYVSSSGTYATATTGSHAGILTIRESGGGTTWASIPIDPFPVGQSQIGAYTIPTGFTGYLLSKNIFIDSTKTADIYFFQRPAADDVATPYSGIMRLVEREVGVTGGYQFKPLSPKSTFVGPCDVGFMGVMSVGTSECSVEFELLLVQD